MLLLVLTNNLLPFQVPSKFRNSSNKVQNGSSEVLSNDVFRCRLLFVTLLPPLLKMVWPKSGPKLEYTFHGVQVDPFWEESWRRHLCIEEVLLLIEVPWSLADFEGKLNLFVKFGTELEWKFRSHHWKRKVTKSWWFVWQILSTFTLDYKL